MSLYPTVFVEWAIFARSGRPPTVVPPWFRESRSDALCLARSLALVATARDGSAFGQVAGADRLLCSALASAQPHDVSAESFCLVKDGESPERFPGKITLPHVFIVILVLDLSNGLDGLRRVSACLTSRARVASPAASSVRGGYLVKVSRARTCRVVYSCLVSLGFQGRTHVAVLVAGAVPVVFQSQQPAQPFVLGYCVVESLK